MNLISFISWRFYLVIAIIIIATIGLMWRVFDLTILNQHFLRQQGDERILRLVKTPAFRGMIVDRNGSPLAVSTTVYSVWMNPQEFTPTKKDLISLQNLLKIQAKLISSLYQRNQAKKREFVYIKRSLSPDLAKQIKALHIPGIYLQQDYRRYYPEGEVVAQVVGFTNIDDQGQEGIELAYNLWLSGKSGKKWVIKDRLGRMISEIQTIHEQKPGNNLVLSVDRRLQYLAYRELLKGILENQASSGSAIILDVKTGEILAMVNQPSFNPNSRDVYNRNSFRNRAVTDIFEPGSTIKAFSVASALDSGHFHPDTVIDTYPGWLRVGRNVVMDEHNNGPLTVTQILQKSSNVGVTKIVLSLPPDHLWSVLHRVGFGEITGVGFPGEQGGVLVKHQPWGAFTLATLSWGYGISVTTLQLARAYAVIANGGLKLPVSLLRVEQPPAGEQVMDKKIAKQLVSLLESVVTKGGTGELASVPGYRVAGKTGTAKLVGQQGYQKHKYVSSFVGMAPASQPQLVVAVVIHDPQGKNYHGGQVSGPVFEKIMEGTLRMLDIPPDA
ncbi:MAG: cell division protein [Gammaproteobacteria bacterium RIFCSPHIGHO2_12_FULL_37_14]|nr:MAG: cell division protein [Gammaproteobacteria bacterium RIFCSPHIGHO2_12_FULL_37_14]